MQLTLYNYCVRTSKLDAYFTHGDFLIKTPFLTGCRFVDIYIILDYQVLRGRKVR